MTDDIPGRRVLSFDVGVKHLAYCLAGVPRGGEAGGDGAEGTPWTIEAWGILPLADPDERCQKISLDMLCQRLVEALDDTFDSSRMLDLVLIENQPVMKNPTMKSLQMMIYTYFQMRKLHMGTVEEVRLVSAGRKNKLLLDWPDDVADQLRQMPAGYARNKRQSVANANALLDSGKVRCADPQLRESYGRSRKRDDWADALLQAWVTLAVQTPVLVHGREHAPLPRQKPNEDAPKQVLVDGQPKTQQTKQSHH